VAWDQIVKGYEYEEGNYVALSEEDFKRANVEATQTVEIVAFVDVADIEPIYFDTPYYLSPGKRGEKGYALLRETLERSGKAAIATVVIRTRQYMAVVRPMDKLLLLNTLRYADEIRPTDELELPEKAHASAREVDMALKLVKEMSEPWKPEQYHDTYREDILARIEKKVKAGETREVAEPGKDEEEPKRKSAEVIDLMALLKRSVKQEEDKPRKRTTRVRQRVARKPAKPHPATHQRAAAHHERRKRA
jgi:DNA end-binding protein Ku